MATYMFKSAVKDLFGSIDTYNENKEIKVVKFRAEEGFNAESLFKLSNLLRTRTIHCTPGIYGAFHALEDELVSYIEVAAVDVVFD